MPILVGGLMTFMIAWVLRPPKDLYGKAILFKGKYVQVQAHCAPFPCQLLLHKLIGYNNTFLQYCQMYDRVSKQNSL